MARKEDGPRRASVKPADAERGGTLGIPVGATFTITEASWTTWGEFGEKAVTKGRSADDPVLRIVADVEGQDDPIIEGLGAGKANRLQPSRDGEYLEIPDGSTAAALSDMSNANVFMDTIFYREKKDRAYKMHGSKAVKDDLLDDGISAALVGLEGVAGRELVKREGLEEGEGRGKARPTLIVEKILTQPSGDGKPAKKGSTRSRSRDKDEDKDEDDRPSRSRSRDDKDEDDDRGSRRRGRDKDDVEEERPSRSRSKKDDAGDDDAVAEAAEQAVLEALKSTKYRKGLPIDRAFAAIFNVVRDEKNADDIAKMGEDTAWLKHKDRPWKYEKEDDVLVSLD